MKYNHEYNTLRPGEPDIFAGCNEPSTLKIRVCKLSRIGVSAAATPKVGVLKIAALKTTVLISNPNNGGIKFGDIFRIFQGVKRIP